MTRDWHEHLAFPFVRLRSQRPPSTRQDPSQPGQEYGFASEHEHKGGRTFPGRTKLAFEGSQSLKPTWTEGPGASCAPSRADSGDGKPHSSQGRVGKGADRAQGLRVTVFATLLAGLQPGRGSLPEGRSDPTKYWSSYSRGNLLLVEATGRALEALGRRDAKGLFERCGYRQSIRLLWNMLSAFSGSTYPPGLFAVAGRRSLISVRPRTGAWVAPVRRPPAAALVDSSYELQGAEPSLVEARRAGGRCRRGL